MSDYREQKHCLNSIRSSYATLSPSQKKIADYILSDSETVVHTTIDQLADRIGTSESTLVRFVRKIGFRGYQQFRISLATEIVENRNRVYENPIGLNDNLVDLVFSSAINTLTKTGNMIREEQVRQVAKMMMAAESIYLFGLGGSYVVALDAFHKFIRLGLKVHLAEDFHMQLMSASQAGEKDIALIFSHSGVNTDALDIRETLDEVSCPVIAITSNSRSTLAAHAKRTLVVHSQNNDIVNEAFSTRIAQMALNDVLYLALLEECEERGVSRLERMRNTIAKRRL
ncbi:MAG: MurR/RpiR family transcriptional regulator [Sphaerochaetaceae bacterium]|nr:MurR/RpiR family transcriptional regulator [Sphaerochaetaceae bacterium]